MSICYHRKTKPIIQFLKRDDVLYTIISISNWTFIVNLVIQGMIITDEHCFFSCDYVLLSFFCFRCVGLVLLETYSALEDQELLDRLPKFLDIESEVTGNAAYSMFNLSLVEDWDKTKHFCHYLKGNNSFIYN